jgi:hypothetical protein
MPIDSGYTRPPRQGPSVTHHDGPKPSQRTPPPESTGAEANYLAKQVEARSPMVFCLVGGERVEGVIEYYDRDIIKIARGGTADLILRKENIAYMHKAESARRKRPQS